MSRALPARRTRFRKLTDAQFERVLAANPRSQVKAHRRAARTILSLILAAALAPAQDADLLLYHGKIVTVDPQFRIADSIAIRGDRIVAVGARDAVGKSVGARTARIDLQGATVLPGLMDSHVHSSEASMYEFDHPVPTMETVADVLRYLESRAAASKPGDWVVLRQVFITRLRDQRFPTRAELDKVAPHNPVLFGTGPDAAVNSLALKVSGIEKNPEAAPGKPCRIERNAAGEPTGILRNCDRLIPVHTGEKVPTQADHLRQLKLMVADLNATGITSISERDLPESEIDLYRQLKDQGQLHCRVYVMYRVDAAAPVDQVERHMLDAARNPLHQYNNMLWVRGIKTYMDGGMLTGSAYMLKPWGISQVYSITDPNYRGMRYIEAGKLFEIARFALKHDLQFTAHSVGDGAVQAMIDAYVEINNEFPIADARPSITHANFMPPGGIEKIKKLGIVLDLQPDWLWLDGATLLKQFGHDRMAAFQPYKTLFENGIHVGGGSDHMQKIGSLRSINPYNPFLGMWITLTRQPRWSDQPLYPEQRLTREQAIRLYTINNAYLMFDEKQKGSLEPGKLADLIVLDRDILTCPVDEVKDIQVKRTYLGGKQVYER